MVAPISTLFQLRARDAQSAIWSPFFMRFGTGFASASFVLGDGLTGPVNFPFAVTTPSLIPPGFVFWVESVSVAADVTVQVVRNLSVQILNENANPIAILGLGGPGLLGGAVGERFAINFEPGILLLSGTHFLQAHATFNAANIGNTISLGVNGFITVRGNLAL